MTKQNKGRKLFATTATAALVASAIVPVASAASLNDFNKVPTWAQDAVQYLTDNNILQGDQNGNFNPSNTLTRAEAAEVLYKAVGLEVTGEENFSDVDSSDWFYNAVVATSPELFEGDGTGKFAPKAELTRAQAAKVIVSAYKLTGEADLTAFTDTNTVPAWAKDFFSTAVANGVINGKGTKLAPNDKISRAEFATMVKRAIEPEAGALEIKSVTALTEDGHVLRVDFNKPVTSIDKAEVVLQETSSKARVGIDRIEVAANGLSAEIITYDNTDNNAPYEVKRGVEYSLSIGELTTKFTRPYFLDEQSDARVTEIDAENKDFTVTYDGGEETIEVPDGVEFDYEAAVGMEIRVWFTGDNKLVEYQIADESKVLYDAFEVSTSVDASEGEGEIELQTADKKYDLSTDEDGDINTIYYLDGEEVTDIETLADADYAKIILNDKGDVAYIYAYDFNDLTVVESVNGTIVEGLGDADVDLKDYVLVKDGKTIQVKDLVKGDAVYFAEDAKNSLGEEGYAVVYNNSVSGKIETIYDDSFVVNGKKYDYGFSYVDEDGDLQTDFQKDQADDYEAEDVTIYVDFNGDIQLLTGVEAAAGNEVGVLLTDEALVYADAKGKPALELEYVTEDGKEELADLNFDQLDSITVDGQKYDLEQDADENKDFIVKRSSSTTFTINTNNGTDNDALESITLDDNTAISLTKDDDGDITDLEIFAYDELKDGKDIEPGDKNAELTVGNKRLQKDTIVFVAENGASTDADDVEAYQYADIDFDIDSDDAEVYYNEDGDVEYIVVEDTVASNTTDYIAVVDSYETTDGDVTRLVAYVAGKKVTYKVDEVAVADVRDILADGQVVKIKVNDESGEVDDIFVPGNEEEFSGEYFLLNQTGATNITSSKFTLDGVEYQKGDNFQIIDATDSSDLDTESSLSSIKDKTFHVILEGENSRYVDTIVIVDGNDDSYDGLIDVEDEVEVDETAPGVVTNYTFSDTDLDADQIGGVVTFEAVEAEDVAKYIVTVGSEAVEISADSELEFTIDADTAATTVVTIVAVDEAGNEGNALTLELDDTTTPAGATSETDNTTQG